MVILDKEINTLKELKAVIADLSNTVATAENHDEEWVKAANALAEAQSHLNDVSKARKGQIDALNTTEENSINLLKQKIKDLNAQRNAMDMNSEAYKKATAELKVLNDQLRESGVAAGDMRANVGNYTQSIIDAFGKMGISMGGLQAPFVALTQVIASGGKGITDALGNISTSIGNLGKTMASMGGPAAAAKTAITSVGSALKALIANPVGAAIMAIVIAFKTLSAIVNKVKEAINSNEESQMALKEAMSAFQPVIDAVNNAFDALGQVVVKVIGWIGDAFRKLREAAAAVTDFFGITKGAKKRVKEQNDQYKELAKSQNQLIKNKREYQKLNASDKAEVERLREQASETQNLEEKHRLLEEAKNKQSEIDNRNIEIAKQELAILKQLASQTANNAEMNDRLAAAQARVAEAEATAAANAKQFNKQLNATTGSARDLREEAKKLAEQLVDSNKDELTQLEEKYKKEYELLNKYKKTRFATALLTAQYEKEKAQIVINQTNKMLNTQRELVDEIAEGWKTYEGGVIGSQLALNVYEKRMKDMDDYLTKWDEIAKDKDSITKFINEMNAAVGSNLTPPDEVNDEIVELLYTRLIFIASEYRKKFLEGYDDMIMAGINETKSGLNLLEKEIHGKEIARMMVGGPDVVADAMDNADLVNKSIEQYEIILTGLTQVISEYQQKYDDALAAGDEKAANEAITILNRYKKASETVWDEYYNMIATRRQWALEEERVSMETWTGYVQDGVKTAIDMFSQLNTVLQSIYDLKVKKIEVEKEEGKISEQEATRQIRALDKYKKIMLGVQIASIAASTAAAAMELWKSYMAEKVANAETAAATGPAAAATLAALNTKSLVSFILNGTALATNAAAQIAAATNGTIAQTTYANAPSSQGTTATPTEIPSNPYTYSRTLQTQEDLDELNSRPLWVSVQDISNMQNQVKVVDQESTF